MNIHITGRKNYGGEVLMLFMGEGNLEILNVCGQLSLYVEEKHSDIYNQSCCIGTITDLIFCKIKNNKIMLLVEGFQPFSEIKPGNPEPGSGILSDKP